VLANSYASLESADVLVWRAEALLKYLPCGYPGPGQNAEASGRQKIRHNNSTKASSVELGGLTK